MFWNPGYCPFSLTRKGQSNTCRACGLSEPRGAGASGLCGSACRQPRDFSVFSKLHQLPDRYVARDCGRFAGYIIWTRSSRWGSASTRYQRHLATWSTFIRKAAEGGPRSHRLRLCLFIIRFFPQWSTGPIVRAAIFLGDLWALAWPTVPEAYQGASLILTGCEENRSGRSIAAVAAAT